MDIEAEAETGEENSEEIDDETHAEGVVMMRRIVTQSGMILRRDLWMTERRQR